jgi:ribosome maturation protein SDO1
MRIRVTMPAKEGKRLKDKIMAVVDTAEDDYWGDEWELVSCDRIWALVSNH